MSLIAYDGQIELEEDDWLEADESVWCYECDEPLTSCVCDEPFDPDDLPPEAFMEFPDDADAEKNTCT
jgi:hypothetical protein